MKLTISKLVAAESHLAKIFSADVKGTIAFSLKRNMSAIGAVLDDFNAAKQALIIKLCDKDDAANPIVKNNQYTFSDPVRAKCFTDEYAELMKQEVEVEVKTVPITAFEKAEISAAALLSCDFMFAE